MPIPPKKLIDPKFENVMGPPGNFSLVMEKVGRYKLLIPKWIPLGGLTQVLGLPGVGKSAFLLDGICRPCMTGKGTFFDGTPAPKKPMRVLWCDTEGRAGSTITRVEDWKIPIDNFWVPWPDDPLRAVNLDDADHMLRIEYLGRHEGCKVIVIDSLTGAQDNDENGTKIGTRLGALAAIAEAVKASILIAHHARKSSDSQNIKASDSRGSGTTYSYCIAQLGIDRPDPKSKQCRVKVMKENLGLEPEPVGFLITNAGIEYGEAPQVKSSSKPSNVAEWLKSYMGIDCWTLAEKVYEQVDKKEWSRASVQRARESLGITEDAGNVRRRDDGRYEWRIEEIGGKPR